MSVTVKHLNADSTFLLRFSPETESVATDSTSIASTFCVLLDPWLTGPSIVTAPWFAKTERRVPSAIQHLSGIEEPDVVIVSQNKPDHCHKETLLQLRPESKTIIAAEPAAAKTIKSWNYFDPTRVQALSKYDHKSKFGRSLRIRIPPLSPDGLPGEVNIAFIPAKNYMTGLHNAFGITYQPPTHTKATAPVATVDLPRSTRYFHMPLTPATLPPSSPSLAMSPLAARPMSFDQPGRDRFSMQTTEASVAKRHHPSLSKSSTTGSSGLLPTSEQLVARVNPDAHTEDIVQQTVTLSDRSSDVPFHFELEKVPFTPANTLPTPPDSPALTQSTLKPVSTVGSAISPTSPVFQHRKSFAPSHNKTLSSTSSMPNMSSVTPARPKAISIVYSPHGLALSDLQPYVQNHLVRLGALPLTLLFHSFDRAENPWYLGGNIMSGMQGGAEIARALMARCWISAHDEAKDDRGLSVKKLRVQRITADEVRKHLWEGEEGEWLKKKGWRCDVRSLGSGREMIVGPARPLRSGIEGNEPDAYTISGTSDQNSKV
ncbi:hypothetical protein PV11_05279 [Exophiala sideris]|uniref:Uncharacterized protein n=1 Tax=Exophiala sideris TaxID=1016849 RepID=A0A0D1YK23_9EURO|nr:hypothetical protein PV11_05279 [Exophiala sideris]